MWEDAIFYLMPDLGGGWEGNKKKKSKEKGNVLRSYLKEWKRKHLIHLHSSKVFYFKTALSTIITFRKTKLGWLHKVLFKKLTYFMCTGVLPAWMSVQKCEIPLELELQLRAPVWELKPGLWMTSQWFFLLSHLSRIIGAFQHLEDWIKTSRI